MKVAFASCAKIQKQKIQPAWGLIGEHDPDHLLLLGDNVYSPSLYWSHKKMEKRYRQQFQEPNFSQLVNSVPFNAIWDDHDFGRNDSKGAHVSKKKKKRSRELFHQFMNCSTNLPYVYHSFEKGEVKFIMLDVRYYRQRHSKGSKPTVLGAKQEAWLESELNHDKRYTVVCSGSSLTRGSERLAKYEDFYGRLGTMLKDKGRTLFLSGDIHENDFVEHDGFFEATSSGVGREDLDNYGIIEFSNETVKIQLRGRNQRDNQDRTIDAESWILLNHTLAPEVDQ